jgi:hypothetical protein
MGSCSTEKKEAADDASGTPLSIAAGKIFDPTIGEDEFKTCSISCGPIGPETKPSTDSRERPHGPGVIDRGPPRASSTTI